MRVPVVIAVLFACGCGDALSRAELADVRHRLDESQRQSAANQRKVEELEDKVFLLTDQLESQKVAEGRHAAAAPAPRLPVVTLHPQAEDEPQTGDDVVYEGDARSPSPQKARQPPTAPSAPPSFGGAPVLTLEGPKPDGRKLASREAAVVVPASHDNLGVAPVPPIRDVDRLSPSTSTARSDDPLRQYRQAQDALKAGQHDEAARLFRDFVKRWPHHDYADNAQYWLGECFYDRKQFLEAATAFRVAVEKWPLGNKAPDALLKLGYCLIQLGEAQKGRDLLRQLPEAYPRTEAARLAQERLNELSAMEGTR